MQARTRFHEFLWLGGGGCVFALVYSFLAIEFDGATIRWPDTWRIGVAQPYVLGALVLVALAWLWYRGHPWAELLIMLWAPLTLLAGAYWAQYVGVNSVDTLFIVFVALMGAVWAWAAQRTIFRHHRGKRDG